MRLLAKIFTRADLAMGSFFRPFRGIAKHDRLLSFLTKKESSYSTPLDCLVVIPRRPFRRVDPGGPGPTRLAFASCIARLWNGSRTPEQYSPRALAVKGVSPLASFGQRHTLRSECGSREAQHIVRSRITRQISGEADTPKRPVVGCGVVKELANVTAKLDGVSSPNPSQVVDKLIGSTVSKFDAA
jgi:hypothetical protein